MKNYYKAPLPFQGQKRGFLKAFKAALNGFKSDAIYVDLFGGSGLLAHTVKQVYPDAKVVYNDYDGYQERLANIPKTNALMSDLKAILTGLNKCERVPELQKAQVLERLAKEQGYVDWVTVSSNLLYSANFIENSDGLKKKTMYNQGCRNNYDAAGYLDGLELTRDDYRAIFEQYKDLPNVVFLLDPPCLNAMVQNYTKNSWELKDYLSVLDVLDGQSYFYFTSDKSNIAELCEWIGHRSSTANPFAGATKAVVSVGIAKDRSYEDQMYYKNKNNQ